VTGIAGSQHANAGNNVTQKWTEWIPGLAVLSLLVFALYLAFVMN